jgi:hypothetical protein
MTLPYYTLDELREMDVSGLMTVADQLLNEYTKAYKDESPSEDAAKIRDLIVTIHDIIDEKLDNGEI